VQDASRSATSQVKAHLAAPRVPPGDASPVWERALAEEMERTLVAGYACAMALDSECMRLERRVHELAREVRASSREVGALRHAEHELGEREGELHALRDLLHELQEQVAERRARVRGADARNGG